MSWETKAIVAYGWLLTNEEVASLPQEVYDEWVDNEWLILSADKNMSVFSYYTIKADDTPQKITHQFLKDDKRKRKAEKAVNEFYRIFSTREDEPIEAYLWQIFV